MSQSLQLIYNSNLLLFVHHVSDHMWASAPNVFINKQRPGILAVKKDTGQAAEDGHKCLHETRKGLSWKLPVCNSFTTTIVHCKFTPVVLFHM